VNAFATVLHELQVLVALMAALYFGVKTEGNERVILVSSMLAALGGLAAR